MTDRPEWMKVRTEDFSLPVFLILMALVLAIEAAVWWVILNG